MQQVIVEVGNKSQQGFRTKPREMNERLLFQRTLSINLHSLPLLQHVSASECAPVFLRLNKGHIGSSLGQRVTPAFTDAKQTAVTLSYHTPVQVTTGASMPHPLLTIRTVPDAGHAIPVC